MKNFHKQFEKNSGKKYINTKDLWKNDDIQFCRLIAELEYAGVFDDDLLHTLNESMDLPYAHILQIVSRACKKFDKIKEKL